MGRAWKVLVIDPGIKAVFISDYAADAVGDKDILEEGTNLITKPLKKDALSRKVRELPDRD